MKMDGWGLTTYMSCSKNGWTGDCFGLYGQLLLASWQCTQAHITHCRAVCSTVSMKSPLDQANSLSQLNSHTPYEQQSVLNRQCSMMQPDSSSFVLSLQLQTQHHLCSYEWPNHAATHLTSTTA